MLTININSNKGSCTSLTSMSQNLNCASKIDIAPLSTQGPDLQVSPRTPGAGKDYILEVAPDFDAPMDLGV
jgi:hypothetical protein